MGYEMDELWQGFMAKAKGKSAKIAYLKIVLPWHISIVITLASSISRRSDLLGGRCRIIVIVGTWSLPILHFDKAGLRKGKGFCFDGRHQYWSRGDKTAEQC
jgi:hypothetical protein